MKQIDICKAAGILIKDRCILVTHEAGKDFYLSPGWRIEKGETPQDAVIRELKEETGIITTKSSLKFFGNFTAQASGDLGKTIMIDVFIVRKWVGEPRPMSGDEIIEDVLWINSKKIPPGVKLGSIFEHEVIPRLVNLNLID